MPFCASCGGPVEGQFCGRCGAAQPAGAAPQGGQSYQPASGSTAGGLTENVASALCYVLGLITGVLFLALAPYNQNKTVRFHAFQSIFFNLAWIALWIVEMIIGGILTAVLPFGIGLLWGLVGLVIWLGGLIVWIMLLVKAYQGQRWVLPIVGPIAEKQA